MDLKKLKTNHQTNIEENQKKIKVSKDKQIEDLEK